MKYLLTIAAGDNSGGAGLQQDLRVFDRLGFWGLSVQTGLTLQNFIGLQQIEPVNTKMFYGQLLSCLENYPLSAIKIGALCSEDQIQIIADVLKKYPEIPLIADPVFAPSRGQPFLNPKEIESYIEKLIPLVYILTPNIPEWLEIGQRNCPVNPQWVYIKGGHGEGWIEERLFSTEKEYILRKKRRNWAYSHGTGCAFSSALSAYTARGYSVVQACKKASAWVDRYYQKINGAVTEVNLQQTRF